MTRQPSPAQMHRARLGRRTEHLSWASKALYRIEHYSSVSVLALAIPSTAVLALAIGGGFGFPSGFVSGFQVAASTLTVVMVFAIQHTQAREQAATQRKLDELLQAVPGASETLMMLEDAPEHELYEVTENQRASRRGSEATEAASDGGASTSSRSTQ